MAKKVLTPEQQEIKAIKKEKRSQNWTKCWAIVLALALTLCIAFAGMSQGKKNVPDTTPAAGDSGSDAGSSYDGGSDSSYGDSYVDSGTSDGTGDVGTGDTASDAGTAGDTGSSAGTSTGTGDKADGSATANKAPTAAEVAALINKVTGEAVSQKVGYDWSRDCVVKDVQVGNSTVTNGLNSIIKGFDENATVSSVVGSFLGNGSKKETVKKGQTLDTMKITKDDGSQEEVYHGSSYTLKATNLQAGDIQNLQVSGDTYTFSIPDCQNPARNGNTGLSRFTNDIVVREEVETEIKGFTTAVSVPADSFKASYKNIKASVTIKDNKLVKIEYSYAGDAELGIKLIVTAKGTGNLTTKASYSNFQY